MAPQMPGSRRASQDVPPPTHTKSYSKDVPRTTPMGPPSRQDLGLGERGSFLKRAGQLFGGGGARQPQTTFEDLLNQMLGQMEAPSGPMSMSPHLMDVEAALAPFAQQRNALASSDESAQALLAELDQAYRTQSRDVSAAEAAGVADRQARAEADSAATQGQMQAIEAETLAALEAQGVDPSATAQVTDAGSASRASQDQIARALQDQIADQARQQQLAATERSAGADVRRVQADLQRQRSLDQALFGLGQQEAAARAELEQRNAMAQAEAERFNASAQASYQDALRGDREARSAAGFELFGLLQQFGDMFGGGGGGGGGDAARTGILNQLGSGNPYDATLADLLGVSESPIDFMSQAPAALATIEAGQPTVEELVPANNSYMRAAAPAMRARLASDPMRRRPSQSRISDLAQQWFGAQNQGGGAMGANGAVNPQVAALIQMLMGGGRG